MINPQQLGSKIFRQKYNIKYAYVVGSMYKGISSKELVTRMGRAGLIGYFGTGGLKIETIHNAIDHIQTQLKPDQVYGMNLLCHLDQPQLEMQQVELFLKANIKFVEAAAFVQLTPALVKYRLTGLQINPDGSIHVANHILAKVSRPEVAKLFMSPPPKILVKHLVEAGYLTENEARLGELIPMANEICVEADSGGHTDQGVAFVLFPTIKKMAQELTQIYQYQQTITVGLAGGIGTPEAAAAAFMLGADFILTGSINQCTVEAETSDVVKEILAQAEIQDTTYVPAGDMFELGAKVQVFKKGLFFPARANKLYELYQRYSQLDEIDEKTQKQIQEKYFKRTFDDVWAETKNYYLKSQPAIIDKAEYNLKQKMALIFKWYFIHTTRLALSGNVDERLNFQIHCGPALGAFNSWVKDTQLELWQYRHVDAIAEKIMTDTAMYISEYIKNFI